MKTVTPEIVTNTKTEKTIIRQGHDETTVGDKVTYIAFKQHFFTSILLTKTRHLKAELYSLNTVNDSKVDTTFTKKFKAKIPLAFNTGELNYQMNWFYGPADYNLLNSVR